MDLLKRFSSLCRKPARKRAESGASLQGPDGGALTLVSTMPELGAILGMIALVWVSIALLLVRERDHAIDAAQNNTTVLATAFEESTKRIITELDQTLLSARASYEMEGSEFDIGRWAKKMIQSDELRVQVALMDRDGNEVRSTLERSNLHQVNIADRPHFRAQLDPAHDDLFISNPVVGRGSGEQTIQFTRKVVDQNGAFNGVFVLSLGCAQLSAFFDTSEIGDGFVALFNNSGVLLARGPAQPKSVGRNFAADPGFQSLLHSASKLAWSDVAPSGKRIISYRRVTGYPLTVAVAFDRDRIFRQYWYSVDHFLATGMVATAVVLLIGGFWIRQRRRTLANGYALSLTLENMSQGIALVDPAGCTPVTNERALRLLDLPARESNQAVADRLAEVIDAGSDDSVPRARNEAGGLTVKSVRADGRVIEVCRTELPDGGAIHTLTDVTERHKAEERIRYLAHNDMLTGLPNRVLLDDTFGEFVQRAAAAKSMMLTLFIDLDGFKGVNDTLGHLLGDRLLTQVAGKIRDLAGDGDFVARLGGDEFVVLVADGGVERGLELGQRIIDSISRPVMLSGHEIRISASVGISAFPRDGDDKDNLFRKADIALYRAKAEGRSRCVVFEPSMDEVLQRRVLLEEDLRKAIGTAQMHVHYQPKFDCNQLNLVGFEALVRWDHPRHGWVSPAAFIPIAEECGLIGRIGAWTLERACNEASQWPKEYYVAVNVSPIQLRDPEFAAMVCGILKRTGLPPQRLELEITESVMADDSDVTLRNMASLRSMGITFALDDFGTGYSSLSNLLRFQFDAVKIDKCFVQKQTNDAEARAIVEAIVVMSCHIGLQVTAEGVETQEQLALLRQQGCPVVQGYLVGRPMPGWQVPGCFNKHRPATDVGEEAMLAGD